MASFLWLFAESVYGVMNRRPARGDELMNDGTEEQALGRRARDLLRWE